MFRIDTHAHVFHRGLPMVAGRRYTPDYDAPLIAYLDHLDTHGMSHGVLVQPSFLGTDNRYLLDCLDQASGRLRGIAVLEESVAADDLARLNDRGIVGVRLNLLGRPLPPLETTAWCHFLDHLARLGWQVEIQRAARDLPGIIAPLLAAGLTVVVDHFALPDPALGADDPGLGAVLDLARSGALWLKLSAPYRCGPAGKALAHRLYPRLRDGFGRDRLLWGSDWPHTQFEAAEDYTANTDFLAELIADPEEAAAVLANGQRPFRFTS